MPGFAPLRRRKRAPAREGRSQRASRAGQSQELRRESHQFRSDLSQELRLGISRTPLRTGGQGAESQQFRPSDTSDPRTGIHRSKAKRTGKSTPGGPFQRSKGHDTGCRLLTIGGLGSIDSEHFSLAKVQWILLIWMELIPDSLE